MAYTLSDLQSDVLRRIKDSSFSTELIKSYIQDTHDEVLGEKRFSFLERIDTATLTPSSTDYTYPTDLQSVLGLKLADPDDQQVGVPIYMPYREFDARHPAVTQAPEGRPEVYSDYGGKLYWSQPLDKAYGLTLKYLATPTRLTSSSSEPDIPEEYKGILINGAIAGVEEYRGNFDQASIYRRRVEDLADDMLTRYTSRQLLTLPKSRIAGRDRGTY